MSQLDIVRGTIDYIIKYNRKPKPYHIDKDVKVAPISTLEYIHLIIDNDIPKELEDYKIFFNSNFDTQFISSNIDNYISLFSDEESDDCEESYREIREHKVSINEKSILNSNL